MHAINPAWMYDKYLAVVNMAVKKQWVGIAGAPTTIFASGSTYLDDKGIQLGASLIQDKTGYTSFTNFGLSYAYNLQLNYLWQLHLGVAANYQQVAFDLGEIITIDGMADPVLNDKLNNAHNFDSDIGIEFSHPNFKFGFSSQNVVDIFNSENSLQANTNFLYGQFRQNSDYLFNIGAGICGIQYADIYQCEMNVTGYFRNRWDNGLINKPDLFDIGFFYRTGSQAGMILGFSITDNIRVSYSYDYHFGSLSSGSYGTNEIMLTFNINRRFECRNCWY
jgi:type IX secretion system PorP/SprF family membrane protein